MNCLNGYKLFPNPVHCTQCSLELQHLIRTSPIGTRGVSRSCFRVRNISLFTHSLVLLYYYLYSYIHLCFSHVFILLFFLFILIKKIFINNNELFEMDTNSFPTPFIVAVFQSATAFNQDISNWNTGSVTRMDYST